MAKLVQLKAKNEFAGFGSMNYCHANTRLRQRHGFRAYLQENMASAEAFLTISGVKDIIQDFFIIDIASRIQHSVLPLIGTGYIRSAWSYEPVFFSFKKDQQLLIFLFRALRVDFTIASESSPIEKAVPE